MVYRTRLVPRSRTDRHDAAAASMNGKYSSLLTAIGSGPISGRAGVQLPPWLGRRHLCAALGRILDASTHPVVARREAKATPTNRATSPVYHWQLSKGPLAAFTWFIQLRGAFG